MFLFWEGILWESAELEFCFCDAHHQKRTKINFVVPHNYLIYDIWTADAIEMNLFVVKVDNIGDLSLAPPCGGCSIAKGPPCFPCLACEVTR
jgi:hypothetical protein